MWSYERSTEWTVAYLYSQLSQADDASDQVVVAVDLPVFVPKVQEPFVAPHPLPELPDLP